MSWSLEYTQRARKQLRKLDPAARKTVLLWLDKNVDGSDDPRVRGKALVGDRKGSWRYLVGDYRVLCRIEDERLVVLALEIGRRRSVYS